MPRAIPRPLGERSSSPAMLISAASARPGFRAMKSLALAASSPTEAPGAAPGVPPVPGLLLAPTTASSTRFASIMGFSLLVAAPPVEGQREQRGLVRPTLRRPPDRRGLAGERRDGCEIAGGDRCLGGHPGAADADHVRKRQELGGVLRVEAAGRAEARLRQRTYHRLQP